MIPFSLLAYLLDVQTPCGYSGAKVNEDRVRDPSTCRPKMEIW